MPQRLSTFLSNLHAALRTRLFAVCTRLHEIETCHEVVVVSPPLLTLLCAATIVDVADANNIRLELLRQVGVQELDLGAKPVKINTLMIALATGPVVRGRAPVRA